MKKGAELPISIIVISIIALIVLLSVILFYTMVYNRTSSSTIDILVPITNKTNRTSEIIKNISYSAYFSLEKLK